MIAEYIQMFAATKFNPDRSVERCNIHNKDWAIIDIMQIELFESGAAAIRGDFHLN